MPRKTALSKSYQMLLPCKLDSALFLNAHKGDTDSYFQKGATHLPLFRLHKALTLKSTFNNFFLKSTVAFFKLILFSA